MTSGVATRDAAADAVIKAGPRKWEVSLSHCSMPIFTVDNGHRCLGNSASFTSLPACEKVSRPQLVRFIAMFSTGS